MATVLVVDDVPTVAAFVAAALKRDGHVVRQATDAEDALNICGREGGRFDLAVLDAGLCGCRLAEQIRSRVQGGRLLIISGYPADMVMHAGPFSPEDHFLQKPFRMEALQSRVRGLIGTD